MSKTIGPQYGKYVEEDCCKNCDYAGGFVDMGYRVPPRPVIICPECGGELSPTIGRWLYSVKVSWFGLVVESIKHKFVRREDEDER